MTQKVILAAIQRRDIDSFFKLIDMPGYNVNIPVNGETALTLAAKTGLESVTQKLLMKGADLNMRDKNGRTALLHACLHGNSEIVRQMLTAGADTNMCSVNGDFAIHEAISSCDSDTVQTLVDTGADVNRENIVTNYTPVMLALLNNCGDIVRMLIRNGAKLNRTVQGGDTALHLAVQVSPGDIIADLIQGGADMDTLNNMGETPLIVAIYEGRIDIVRLLILCGCSIDKYDFFSPLCVACVQNNPIMVRYLLSEGYNVSRDISVKQNLFFKFEESHPALLDYMFNVRCTQPLSLHEISRVRIRQLMGPNVSSQVGQLSIPLVLQDWIARDVIY